MGYNYVYPDSTCLMDGEKAGKVKVLCKECSFSKTVANEGERPGEVIIEHGRETGHKLTSEKVEGE